MAEESVAINSNYVFDIDHDVIKVGDGTRNGHGVITNAKVYGLLNSIRRAKFPMSTDVNRLNTDLTHGIETLARSKPGEGHDQWLTGVVVQFDLSFTNKAWVEAERYHFLDFVSSQSTMHRIASFDLEQSYNEFVDERIVEIIKEKVKKYNTICEELKNYENMYPEDKGDAYLEIKSRKDDAYLEVLYSNPAGFVITAGITTNYRELKTIYRQRRSHRLPEWRAFCSWVETLPMSQLITNKE